MTNVLRHYHLEVDTNPSVGINLQRSPAMPFGYQLVGLALTTGVTAGQDTYDLIHDFRLALAKRRALRQERKAKRKPPKQLNGIALLQGFIK